VVKKERAFEVEIIEKKDRSELVIGSQVIGTIITKGEKNFDVYDSNSNSLGGVSSFENGVSSIISNFNLNH
jgi:hypothetical protein